LRDRPSPPASLLSSRTWSMADHLRAWLCVDALVMALQRRPEPSLIHHSDHERGEEVVEVLPWHS
jgi:hypothetical protein